MAKAKKMPNGKWRLRSFIGTDSKGKKHYQSFTCATEKECYKAEKQWLKSGGGIIVEEKEKGPTVDNALDTYIESCRSSKRKTYSPRTIREYEVCRKNSFDKILDHEASTLTSEEVQDWVDSRADEGRSPKTIKNAIYLLKPALEKAGNNSILWRDIELPEADPKDYVIPTDDEIITLLDYCKENDPEMYKAIVLGAFAGTRRSEICALLYGDIDSNARQISINKAIVLDETCVYVEKGTKTKAGKRLIDVDQAVINALCNDGVTHIPTSNVVNLSPTLVTSRFFWIKKRLGFNFCFHGLRHYHASIMVALNIPKKYAASNMGQSTYDMIDKVYGQIVRGKEKAVAEAINEHSATVLGGEVYNW